MNKKLIFGALITSAIFASCTSDDMFEQNPQPTVGNRAVVGKVSFKTSNAVAGTRAAYSYDNKQYSFEEGDTIGVVLMDQIVDPDYFNVENEWKNRFRIQDYIQTNYPFAYVADGTWESDAKMLEGNYFLCFPYDRNNASRETYTFTVEEQSIGGKSKADFEKAMVENNAWVGYSKVERGTSNTEAIDAPLYPVFGASVFTIQNDGTESYEIQKIVLHGSKITNKAELKPKSMHFKLDECTLKEDLSNAVDYSAVTSENVELSIEGGVTLATGKTINLPVFTGYSKVTASGDVFLDIYTDKGMIQDVDLTRVYGGTLIYNDIKTDKTLAELGAGKGVKLTFDDTSVKYPTYLEIINTESLEYLIEVNKDRTEPLWAVIMNSESELTKEILDKLNESSIPSLMIETAPGEMLSITENDALDLSKIIPYYGSADIEVTEAVTLVAPYYDNLASDVLMVAEGGELTVACDIKNKIVNAGSVTVNAEKTVRLIESENGTVVNNGTINSIKLTGSEMTNNGTIKNITSASESVITNNGTIDKSKLVSNTVLNNNKNAYLINCVSGTVVIAKNSETSFNTNSDVIELLDLDVTYDVNGTTPSAVIYNKPNEDVNAKKVAAAKVTELTAKSITLKAEEGDITSVLESITVNGISGNGKKLTVASGAELTLLGGNVDKVTIAGLDFAYIMEASTTKILNAVDFGTADVYMQKKSVLEVKNGASFTANSIAPETAGDKTATIQNYLGTDITTTVATVDSDIKIIK